MTKKDYVAIAQAFADNKDRIGPNTTPEGLHSALAFDLSLVLMRDNPRFDRDRFLAACGVSFS